MTYSQIWRMYSELELTKCWKLLMSIKYRISKTNWNCYLTKAMRLKMRFKLTPKGDDRWNLVEMRKSLILRVVSNKI